MGGMGMGGMGVNMGMGGMGGYNGPMYSGGWGTNPNNGW